VVVLVAVAIVVEVVIGGCCSAGAHCISNSEGNSRAIGRCHPLKPVCFDIEWVFYAPE
jgi:hypothetical protein